MAFILNHSLREHPDTLLGVSETRQEGCLDHLLGKFEQSQAKVDQHKEDCDQLVMSVRKMHWQDC